MKSPQAAPRHPVTVNGPNHQKKNGPAAYSNIKSSGYGRTTSAAASEAQSQKQNQAVKNSQSKDSKENKNMKNIQSYQAARQEHMGQRKDTNSDLQKVDQLDGFAEAEKQLSSLSTQQQTYMTSKRSTAKNGANAISDGASAASGGVKQAVTSNRYAMLANMTEDDDLEDSN